MYDALEEMQNYWTVCLDGAKGCGKSYTFLMFQCEEPCLHLTLNSFTCHSYFLELLNKYETLFPPSKFVDLQKKFKKASGISADNVIDLINTALTPAGLQPTHPLVTLGQN